MPDYLQPEPTKTILEATVKGPPDNMRLDYSYDSVSLNCGEGDGLTYCGARQTTFVDNATGLPVEMPHSFLSESDEVVQI